ncbi:hypothetical protein BDZ91DRAFT_846298 [Kalaharituber pfeilii]|nr:hypothetical protein BDZ91DRAFT_846298 [Kalaharituber pfeilii]
MQFTTIVAALLAAATAVVASPVIEARADDIVFCAEQPYKKSDYTCYPNNNNLLCPIIKGIAYLPCGNRPTGACYDPNSYVCVNGFLCPKTHPNRCGDACYNPGQYRCENGKLRPI